MLIPILGGIVGLIVVIVIIVAMQPGSFRVARGTTIAAPPDAVFPHVNELRKWEAWSPWQKIDPQMTQTYDGPPAGTGATMAWEGNKQAGQGRMTITESRPGELIRIKLEFFKPFSATNTAEFAFRPQGGQTIVDWNMTGDKNFMLKFFCLLMSMDKMIGKDFEKGLAALKTQVEGESR